MSSDEEKSHSSSENANSSDEEQANKSKSSSSSSSKKSDSDQSGSESSSSSSSSSSKKSKKSENSEKSKSDNEAVDKSEDDAKEANPIKNPEFILSNEVKIDFIGHQSEDKFETDDRSFTFEKSMKIRSNKPWKIILEVNSELDNLCLELTKNLKNFNKNDKEMENTFKPLSSFKKHLFPLTKKFEEPLNSDDYFISKDELIEQRMRDSPVFNTISDKYLREKNVGNNYNNLPDINERLYPPSFYYNLRNKDRGVDDTQKEEVNNVSNSYNQVLPGVNKYHSFKTKNTIDPNIYRPRNINQAIDILLNKN
jgi:hypothetical protein